VARSLSFADAAALLGGRGNRVVAALDRLVGGVLLTVSATGTGFVTNLFDPKHELARLSGDIVLKVGERLRGVSRLDRTERLAAAHAVTVLTAYFEALGEVRLPFAVKELEFTTAEQVGLATNGQPVHGRLGELAVSLLRADVPMLAPQRSYEETLRAMTRFYRTLSDNVGAFVAGLSVWERLAEGDRERFTETITERLPERAVHRFEELFRRLATTFPELAFWANQRDHQATRVDIRRLTTGLAAVESILAELGTGRLPSDRCAALAKVYQAALRRPILPASESPEGLRMPLLGDAYVNPDFRAAQVQPSDRIVAEYWWAEHPVRQDLQGFLIGHLTSRQAVDVPLLVLGQPGSGKSMLTQMLAARLPASDFLVVRVALRDVSADADLQSQIEQAVRATTGEQIDWPTLVRSADALPVVLLDGFDELLQATGVSQSDYLQRVADFQRREADLGRAVVVVVTSRTAVADRARLPHGMVTVRLEPFRDEQIAQWLGVWEQLNRPWFASRGLLPPPVDLMRQNRELAAQPLLLLMLALYDADGNALQREDAALEKSDLYERLLTSFAEREVRKTQPALSDPDFARAIDHELLHLSVTAFGMFNRRRQWVTQAELDQDLTALVNEPTSRAPGTDMRANLSAGQLVIGRFFFIHRAQAMRDSSVLQTYEFLHATFGEYLVGRLLTRELNDLADDVQFSERRGRSVPVDGSFLRALLSFAPLTMRGTVMSFLTELIDEMPAPRRELLGGVLLTLFHSSLDISPPGTYESYEPEPLSGPARFAAYSANLTLLAVLVLRRVRGRQLFPDKTYPVDEWRATAMLWRSQLPDEGWTGLVDAMALVRGWDGGRREIHLRPKEGSVEAPPSDLYWTYRYDPDHEWRPTGPGSWFIWEPISTDFLREQSHFQCAKAENVLAHALEPFGRTLGSAIATFHDVHDNWPPGRPVSAAHALIKLWLTRGQYSDQAELSAAYETCLWIAVQGFSPGDDEGRDMYGLLVLRQMIEDRDRLPMEVLRRAVDQIHAAEKADRRPLGSVVAELASQLLPEQAS
jgi:hypothetical protein